MGQVMFSSFSLRKIQPLVLSGELLPSQHKMPVHSGSSALGYVSHIFRSRRPSLHSQEKRVKYSFHSLCRQHRRSVTVPGAQPVVPAVFAAVAVGFRTHAALGRQWML